MNKKSGITLVESLVYIAVVSIVTGAAVTAYIHLTGSAKLHSDYLYDIERALKGCESIKSDIRKAQNVLPQYRNFTKSSTCLILGQDSKQTVIYQFKQDRLYRYCINKDSPVSKTLFMDNIQKVEFSTDKISENLIVTFQLTLCARSKKMNVRPFFAFSEIAGYGGVYAKNK
ncbi:Tfp pilus assembly protein FimT/FimU [Planctomycetota bacterium]